MPIDDPSANAGLAKASPVMRKVLRCLIENADAEKWGESIWLHVRPVGRIETFMVGVPLTTIFRDEEKAMLHFDVSRNRTGTS